MQSTKRNSHSNGKNRKKEVRPLVLPLSISQNHDAFIINCYDHAENISVKGLWEKQDTILDLMENLPRFLRWMKKSRHRSLTVNLTKDEKTTLYCEINHADRRLRNEKGSGMDYTVHARPLKDNGNN